MKNRVTRNKAGVPGGPCVPSWRTWIYPEDSEDPWRVPVRSKAGSDIFNEMVPVAPLHHTSTSCSVDWKQTNALLDVCGLLKFKCSFTDHIHTSVWLKNCFMAPTRGWRGIIWRLRACLQDETSEKQRTCKCFIHSILGACSGSEPIAKPQLLRGRYCAGYYSITLERIIQWEPQPGWMRQEGDVVRSSRRGGEVGHRCCRWSQGTLWAGTHFSFFSCSPREGARLHSAWEPLPETAAHIAAELVAF